MPLKTLINIAMVRACVRRPIQPACWPRETEGDATGPATSDVGAMAKGIRKSGEVLERWNRGDLHAPGMVGMSIAIGHDQHHSLTRLGQQDPGTRSLDMSDAPISRTLFHFLPLNSKWFQSTAADPLNRRPKRCRPNRVRGPAHETPWQRPPGSTRNARRPCRAETSESG